ncbi:hypothetical protein CDIK_3035 [Cucumispora dikerogammari]|nr:hypothetical protein CDIK_3035 [Cucumispora dikerogammari]
MLAILSKLSTIHCPDYTSEIKQQTIDEIEYFPVDEGSVDTEFGKIEGFFDLEYSEKLETPFLKADLDILLSKDYKIIKSKPLYLLRYTRSSIDGKLIIERCYLSNAYQYLEETEMRFFLSEKKGEQSLWKYSADIGTNKHKKKIIDFSTVSWE